MWIVPIGLKLESEELMCCNKKGCIQACFEAYDESGGLGARRVAGGDHLYQRELDKHFTANWYYCQVPPYGIEIPGLSLAATAI